MLGQILPRQRDDLSMRNLRELAATLSLELALDGLDRLLSGQRDRCLG